MRSNDIDKPAATVIGRAAASSEAFSVLGNADNTGPAGNSNENAAHNQEKTLQAQFFKEITRHMPNAEEVHVTGTGTAQEQFIHFLGRS